MYIKKKAKLNHSLWDKVPLFFNKLSAGGILTLKTGPPCIFFVYVPVKITLGNIRTYSEQRTLGPSQ